MRGLPAAAASLTALLALLSIPGAQAGLGLPDPLTERGQVVTDIYDVIVVLGIVVFVIVFVWLVIVMVRYRETTGKGRATHERERHNIWAELAWFVVPLIMVLSIGYIAYAGLVELDHGLDASEAEVEVKIVGSQWNWAAIYPNGVVINSSPDPASGAVKNESVFYVPADTVIRFNVTASDVIHAFQVTDANQAYVMFVDANPLGANKYNQQVVRLPAGEYFVQCNKYCENPGHAYMKARIQAVPRDHYAHWLAGHAAALSSTMKGYVTQSFPLAIQGGTVQPPAGATNGTVDVVANTRVVVQLESPSEDLTLEVDGQTPKTIRAGETADLFYGFDAPTEGNYVLRVTHNGQPRGNVTFRAVEATPVTINMRDFYFDAPTGQLRAGETFFVTAPNLGATTHDVHIGRYTPGAPESGAFPDGFSPAVPAGATGSFVMTPDESGTFDLWCNQPGHVGLGMITKVTIA